MKNLESLGAVAVKVNKLVFNENKGSSDDYKQNLQALRDVMDSMSAIVVYLGERPP